jgi:hypothetical protein
MLTDLQQRKLSALFKTTQDPKRPDIADKKAFEYVLGHMAELFDLSKDSPRYLSIQGALMGQWDFLARACGKSTDGQITKEEYLKAYDTILADKQLFHSLVGATVESVVRIADANNDQKISETESIRAAMAFGTPEAKAKEVFHKLDLNKDGHLDNSEVRKAVEEFYYSNDPNAAANWLFGPF